MAAIESILHERRVFPRAATITAQAGVDAYKALVGGGRARLRMLLGQAGARDAQLEKALHEGARRIKRAFLQVI